MKNILLIGPRKHIKKPEMTGGVIALFEDLITYCDRHEINYIVVDTNKANYRNKLVAYIMILSSIIVKTPKVRHVALHGTANDFLMVAPFALMVSKLLCKQFSLRKFAGNFIEIFENYSPMKKNIILYTLKKSLYNFFETKYLVEYFKKYNESTYWFPNVRRKQSVFTDDIYKKKFIFLGAVSEEKGIDILCEASNLLPDGYQIDIYGTLYDHYTNIFFDDYNVNYKGNLKPEEVISTLKEYNILLLPSFREGYPGVIIEAFSVALPVIATNLQGIKEIVIDKSGKLIDVNNIEQLKVAMEEITQESYIISRQSAIEQFENFDTEIQTKKYFERIDES